MTLNKNLRSRGWTGGLVDCSQICGWVSSSWGSVAKPCSSAGPHSHTWLLPVWSHVCCLCIQLTFLWAVLLETLHGGKGHFGVTGSRYSFSFCFFQPSVYLILFPPPPCGPVEHCLLLYCSKVLIDLWMSVFLPWPPFSWSVLKTSCIICRALCLKIKNVKRATVEREAVPNTFLQGEG